MPTAPVVSVAPAVSGVVLSAARSMLCTLGAPRASLSYLGDGEGDRPRCLYRGSDQGRQQQLITGGSCACEPEAHNTVGSGRIAQKVAAPAGVLRNHGTQDSCVSCVS